MLQNKHKTGFTKQYKKTDTKIKHYIKGQLTKNRVFD